SRSGTTDGMAVATQVLTVLGAVAAALVLGGMIMFAGITARLLFAHLPDDTATPLLRKLFPTYYMYMLGAAAAGAIALAAAGRFIDGGLLALVAIGFGVAHWWLQPQANHLADRRDPERSDIEMAFMTVQMRGARLGLLQAGLAAAVIVRLAL